MNRVAAALAVLLFLTLSTYAQNQAISHDDSAAVRSTVTDYIEAYYTGDAARMEKVLHADYVKHQIHGNMAVREQTAADLVQAARSGRGTRMANKEQVTVLDVVGNIASAKLVTPGWTDYLTLTRTDGQWKILSVVQQIEN